MLTISESSETVEVCLTTQSIPVMDITINVSVIYDSAGEEGEIYAGTNVTLCTLYILCAKLGTCVSSRAIACENNHIFHCDY